jgi:hypothetical protein
MHGTVLPSSTPLDTLMNTAQGNQASHMQTTSTQSMQQDARSTRNQTRTGRAIVPEVGVRVSTGNHVTVRKKDMVAAQRNRKARQQRDARTRYWDSV